MGLNQTRYPDSARRSSPVLMFIELLVIFLMLLLIVFVVIFVIAAPNSVVAIPTPVPTLASGALPIPTQVNPAVNPTTREVLPSPTAHSIISAPTADPSALDATGTPTAIPLVEGFFDFPPDVNPLTGLKVEDPSRLERRPVMVKVSNFPRTGRPHAGLSFADIVFEYYIGYGLNRFAAIYLGTDAPQVGPIRSGRLVDAQLGELYQSILVYGNADPTIDEVILAELGNRALAEKFLPTPPKYRMGPVMETNLFTNTAEVTDYVNQHQLVSNGRRDLRGMVFGDFLSPNNKPATQVGVQFWTTTRGEWKYDAEKGKYLRWIEEPVGDKDIKMIPLVDRLTDQQLEFSNIVILFATYTEFAPTKHDIKLYDNEGGKRAIYFRDGVMSEGVWRTGDNGHPIQFFNTWNTPYQLKPGNTWIVLAGDASTFNDKGDGVWDLRFDLP